MKKAKFAPLVLLSIIIILNCGDKGTEGTDDDGTTTGKLVNSMLWTLGEPPGKWQNTDTLKNDYFNFYNDTTWNNSSGDGGTAASIFNDKQLLNGSNIYYTYVLDSTNQRITITNTSTQEANIYKPAVAAPKYDPRADLVSKRKWENLSSSRIFIFRDSLHWMDSISNDSGVLTDSSFKNSSGVEIANYSIAITKDTFYYRPLSLLDTIAFFVYTDPDPRTGQMVLITADTVKVRNAARWAVELPQDYYIDVLEVTTGMYRKFDSTHLNTIIDTVPCPEGKNYPVVNVSWYDAVKYCNWRSQKEGLNPCYDSMGTEDILYRDTARQITSVSMPRYSCNFNKNGYRLPTEAEWELAAKGGQNYTYATSNNQVMNNANCSNTGDVFTGVAPVGQFNPNPFGIYDQTGNVREWTNCWVTPASPITSPETVDSAFFKTTPEGNTEQDTNWAKVLGKEEWKTGKTLKGGNFSVAYSESKTISMYAFTAVYKSDNIGFRCVRKKQ